MNDRIEVLEVDLIDENHNRLGVMPTADALALAKERKLDLLVVEPDAMPPIAKIINYGRYMFEMAKRQREAMKRRHRSDVEQLDERRRNKPENPDEEVEP